MSGHNWIDLHPIRATIVRFNANPSFHSRLVSSRSAGCSLCNGSNRMFADRAGHMGQFGIRATACFPPSKVRPKYTPAEQCMPKQTALCWTKERPSNPTNQSLINTTDSSQIINTNLPAHPQLKPPSLPYFSNHHHGPLCATLVAPSIFTPLFSFNMSVTTKARFMLTIESQMQRGMSQKMSCILRKALMPNNLTVTV